MNELALFAGAGGGILGSHLLGWCTVCAVERNAYPAQILAQRQNDGILRPFPIWSDVQSFDGRPWRGIVDVISGGFPCQDISGAGKGAGISAARSGLWSEMRRIIGEVRPHRVYVENSPLLTRRGLWRVLGDLAEMGFDAEWGVISAENTGAPHERKRIWIMAYANCYHELGWRGDVQMGRVRIEGKAAENGNALRIEWPPEPSVGRVVDGVAYRMDRLNAIGNGQVPRVAAAAFEILSA